MMEYVRTLEDVDCVVSHAKLDVSDIRPLTQTLYFAQNQTDLKLLELNDEIIESLKKEPLRIKGDPEEKAVVCTRDATYDIKAAETSNSLLLIQNLEFNIETQGERRLEEKRIFGVLNEYFEIKKTKPRLQKLRRILDQYPFTGPENEDFDILTTEELFNKVQASEKEFLEALKDMDAFLLDDKWRILGVEYHFRMFSHLLNLIDENSWQVDSIPIGKTIETLRDLIPSYVMDHLIQIYLLPTSDEDDDGDRIFALNEYKVCRFIGGYLLRSTRHQVVFEFFELWSQTVPEGLNTDLVQLEGIAIVQNSSPPVIKYFPECELPENESERFERLFQEMPQWTFEQIEPYVKKITSEKQSVNSLLTRYCRVSMVAGVKMFSSRHGK